MAVFQDIMAARLDRPPAAPPVESRFQFAQDVMAKRFEVVLAALETLERRLVPITANHPTASATQSGQDRPFGGSSPFGEFVDRACITLDQIGERLSALNSLVEI